MTESLAEALSKEGNDQLTYDSALRAVSKLDSWKMDSPDFATFDKRVVEFKDLPLKLAHSRPTKLTHIVDVVEDMDDNVDRGAIQELMANRGLVDWPAPFGPRAPPPSACRTNVCLQPTTPGKCNLYKHLVFEEKIDSKFVDHLCHGKVYYVDFGSNTRSGAKPFMHLWQRLHGFHAHYFRFGTDLNKGSKPLELPEDIDRAYTTSSRSTRPGATIRTNKRVGSTSRSTSPAPLCSLGASSASAPPFRTSRRRRSTPRRRRSTPCASGTPSHGSSWS